MKPVISGDDIEFFVIQPIYKKEILQVTKRGKDVVDPFGNKLKIENDKFIREVWLKITMKRNDVRLVGEYVGTKGEVLKTRAMIYNSVSNAYYKVAHSKSDIDIALKPNLKTEIGFSYR